MKKLFSALCIVAMVAITTVARSQSAGGQGYLKSAPTHAVQDTANNTTVLNQNFTLPGYWDIVSVQSTFTKITGATIAGTAALYGSNDNFGFSLIGSSQTLTNVTSQTFSWSVTPSLYRYYRLVITPSGTESISVTTPILFRRKPSK